MSDITGMLPHIKLRFNIEHPSLEECYIDGYECAVIGMDEEQNPYRHDTQNYEQWLDGWWAGFYGESPLFELASNAGPFTAASNGIAAAKNCPARLTSGLITDRFLINLLKIGGAVAATALVGYQLFELVAQAA